METKCEKCEDYVIDICEVGKVIKEDVVFPRILCQCPTCKSVFIKED